MSSVQSKTDCTKKKKKQTNRDPGTVRLQCYSLKFYHTTHPISCISKFRFALYTWCNEVPLSACVAVLGMMDTDFMSCAFPFVLQLAFVLVLVLSLCLSCHWLVIPLCSSVLCEVLDQFVYLYSVMSQYLVKSCQLSHVCVSQVLFADILVSSSFA